MRLIMARICMIGANTCGGSMFVQGGGFVKIFTKPVVALAINRLEKNVPECLQMHKVFEFL